MAPSLLFTAGPPRNGASVPATDGPMRAILDVLRRGEKFLVCSHSRPDGDAVGSMLAMGMFLEQMGKRAHLVTADRIPIIYNSLPWRENPHTPSRRVRSPAPAGRCR